MLDRLQFIFRFYTRSLPAMLVFALIATALSFVVYLVLPSPDMTGESPSVGGMAFMFMTWSINTFFAGMLVCWLDGIHNEKGHTLNDCMRFSLYYWPQLAVVTFTTWFFTLLGTLAFILPGVFIAVRLSFAPFITALENKSPVLSLLESNRRVAPVTWRIMGDMLVISIGVLVLFLGLNFGLNRLAFSEQVSFPLVSFLIYALAGLPFSLLSFYYLNAEEQHGSDGQERGSSG